MASDPKNRSAKEGAIPPDDPREPYPTGNPADPYAGKKAAHPQLVAEEEAPPPPEGETQAARAADNDKSKKGK